MFPLGGATTLRTPLPAVNDRRISRCSKSNACVGVPGRMATTDVIDAAFGVSISNVAP